MLQTIIGDKLRYFRKLRKMTQEQVGDELGLSESAYANMKQEKVRLQSTD